jgi:hypothetical protein
LRRTVYTLAALAAVAVAGCQKRDEIRRYTVNKPLPLAPVARANPHQDAVDAAAPQGEPTDRTLGAIVLLPEHGWFFKLTGPKDPVAAQAEVFTNFVKTVRFSSDGKPSWTLPAGWTETPGNQIRRATLAIPGEPPLEVTVTVLSKSEPDENYLLLNINRWRGQLQLPPIAAGELATETTRVELDGTAAILVNIVGHAAPGTMRGPFSGARNGN